MLIHHLRLSLSSRGSLKKLKVFIWRFCVPFFSSPILLCLSIYNYDGKSWPSLCILSLFFSFFQEVNQCRIWEAECVTNALIAFMIPCKTLYLVDDRRGKQYMTKCFFFFFSLFLLFFDAFELVREYVQLCFVNKWRFR